MKIKKWNSIGELLNDNLPQNQIIVDNLVKAFTYINRKLYDKIFVSISGGADSDIVLDICYRCDKDNKCVYYYFDTGLEFKATKEHIKYLEEKYNIKIERESIKSNSYVLQRRWSTFCK